MDTFVGESGSSRIEVTAMRASGRVGNLLGRAYDSAPITETLDPREIISIYRSLLDLREKDGSELSKAISYGLKILKETASKEKKSFRLRPDHRDSGAFRSNERQ